MGGQSFHHVRDHPRSRGEYLPSVNTAHIVPGSSPLSRGIHLLLAFRECSVGIIPALAGNTRLKPDSRQNAKDHPRSRGEYAGLVGDVSCESGSSPLSRGILPNIQSIHHKIGIIPALAGNTFRLRPLLVCTADHPRSRGEYGGRKDINPPGAGSSPLSRGILGSGLKVSETVGIIPALAGNTSRALQEHHCRQDHPRSRGEYARGRKSQLDRQGSSPLSRGIRSHGPRRAPPSRIIPALAGNTRPRTVVKPDTPDHPRSRGEYTTQVITRENIMGSSPLSRGIPVP